MDWLKDRPTITYCISKGSLLQTTFSFAPNLIFQPVDIFETKYGNEDYGAWQQ